MNIFYLDHDILTCARYHCNKHVVKMIVEYAQLLSTAHRVLDGKVISKELQGKIKNLILLDGEAVSIVGGKLSIINPKCYKVTHFNHPQAVWARKSSGNYQYLFALLLALLKEYERRYKRTHATERLVPFLSQSPQKITNAGFFLPPQTMPDVYRKACPVDGYRTFYINEKAKFAKWPENETPFWFKDGLKSMN